MPLNTSFKFSKKKPSFNINSFLFWQKYSSGAVSRVGNFLLAFTVNNNKILPNWKLEIFTIVQERKNKRSDGYYDVQF